MAENQNQPGSPSQQSGGSGRGFTSTDDKKQHDAANKGGSSEAGRESGESSSGQHGSPGSSGQASTRGGGSNVEQNRPKAPDAGQKGGQH
jgi:general stress protein YciG